MPHSEDEEYIMAIEAELATATARYDRARAALLWIKNNARDAGCAAVIDEAECGLEGE